jgi:hypothetical protein
MPFVPKTYDRNIASHKDIVLTGYNPDITIYYGSDDNIVHVTEIWRGMQYDQTVSGTVYAQYWPTYSYSVTYNAWEETTVS